MEPLISVIIPALDEESLIGSALESLRESDGVEVIIADGGSRDRTVEIARGQGARVVSGPRGKAGQMNAASRSAKGSILLFLHADTTLPRDFTRQVRKIVGQPSFAAGAFELGIDGPGWELRIIERVANIRSRWLKAPYGDQALFVRADLFAEVGGYPEIPIMEDFELVRRLRRIGRVVIAPASVRTSARRWQAVGIWRTTLINWMIVLAYYFGVSPRRLSGWYQG